MGAEVNSLDNLHQTPLMWSVKKNQVKCAEVLLDFKASVDLQDTDGDSALHMACGKCYPAIVGLLLDRGASLTLVNGRGHDCLEVAAKAGASDVAMTIVKHKRLVVVLEERKERKLKRKSVDQSSNRNIIIHLCYWLGMLVVHNFHFQFGPRVCFCRGWDQTEQKERPRLF